MCIYAPAPAEFSERVGTADLDADDLGRFLSRLTLPVELRVVHSPKGTLSGYFDDPGQLAAECEALSGGLGIEAVYATLNPVRPDLLARAHNRVKQWARHTTADADVTRRLWLPIDCDAVRPAGISATPAERDAALATAREVRSYLAARGFPEPLLADSGNGGHALYRLDLANTPDVAATLRRFLTHLAEHFNSDRVRLDTTVFNAARIWKVYGTKVQKGDEVGERRHRLARILELPDDLKMVPMNLLEQVIGQGMPASSLPAPRAAPASAVRGEAFERNRRLAQGVITRGGLVVHKEKDYRGGVLWVLDRCPFCDSADAAAHVEVRADGMLGFACKHNRCQEFHWKEFRAKCSPEHAIEEADCAPSSEAGLGGSLPVVVVNEGQLRQVTDKALAAVRAANQPPRFFRRGRDAVEMAWDAAGAYLKDLKSEDVLALLSEVADWRKERRMRTGVQYDDAHPPENVVRTVRSRLAGELPDLLAIAEAPVFTAAGRLLCQAGYDADSRLYFAPCSGLETPSIPEAPQPRDIEQARDLLLVDLMGDFPFADAASRAHALAALLLPFVRPLIEGPTPLHFIDAPAEGTGKGKLADVICVPATGRDAPKMTEVQGEAEWVKTLFATLRSAPVFVHLDNVRHPLDSAALASVLTAYPDWQARLLGASVLGGVPVLTTWLATGNNVHASKEITRRIVRIRLDARMEHPNTRTGFRHPQLVPWARQHRGELLGAALTLCRAWLAAGRPSGRQTFGSYESWAEVLGGILDVAGVPGFLGNAASLYEEVNTSEGKWRELVGAWAQKFGTEAVGVADLFALTVNHQLGLHDDLAERSKGRGDHSRRIQLGLLLAKRLHQCYGPWRIEQAGDGRNGRLYRLAAVAALPSGGGAAQEAVPPAPSPSAPIPLSELTRGDIPLDVPYVRDPEAPGRENGCVRVKFWLTESQHASLPRTVQSLLWDWGDGCYGWRVRGDRRVCGI
jgi:hypothetical protein